MHIVTTPDREVLQGLQEILTRMGIVVYDRRSIQQLIDEVEAACPELRQVDKLRAHKALRALGAALAAARNHLAASQALEEAENHLKRAGKYGKQLHDEIQPLYSEACESWKTWRLAHRDYLDAAFS